MALVSQGISWGHTWTTDPNKRETAIAKTDGAKLTAELVGAVVEDSGAAWVAEADVAAATEVAFIEGAGMT